ncbi:MAG: prokaryotic E2 ligase family D protein [Acidobacteria bacterium]|nr:prokaryotic E2 ligase family D protein [Acidobacteriota bacterium]
MDRKGKTADYAYQAPAAAADAEAAIYFVEGQYLFHARGDNGETIKYLSPSLVRQAFALEPIDSGWLSPETLRWGTCNKGDYVISFYRPARHRLLIENDEGRATSTLTVPLPGLIFAGLDQSWYIWAARARRFAPDLELFHAPLPNLGGTGLICFGENRHPEVKHGAQEAWRLFISSPFNSHHADGKSREHPKNIISQLSFLHRRKAVRYPVRDLVSLRCTINEAVRRLVNR